VIEVMAPSPAGFHSGTRAAGSAVANTPMRALIAMHADDELPAAGLTDARKLPQLLEDEHRQGAGQHAA
jgi:hypothetical protein